jgi:hypothetical protein
MISDMKTSFLDYYKLILSKVSFDQQLLRKEYTKALNLLDQAEVQELNQWCRQNRYTGLHSPLKN